MSTAPRRRCAPLLLACAVITAGGATGCGLVASDASSIDLNVPDKAFAVDASAWAVDDDSAETYLARSCAAVPTVCQTAAAQECAAGTCVGVCGQGATCELALAISLWRTVNLVSEAPQIKAAIDQSTVDVSIDSLTYEIADNTLNVAIPAIVVYVAPTSVTSPGDPAAKAIGTIAIVDAGEAPSGRQQIAYTATGEADLAAAMSTYQTPFNVILGSTLTIGADSTLPTGKLDALVHIGAHAGL